MIGRSLVRSATMAAIACQGEEGSWAMAWNLCSASVKLRYRNRRQRFDKSLSARKRAGKCFGASSGSIQLSSYREGSTAIVEDGVLSFEPTANFFAVLAELFGTAWRVLAAVRKASSAQFSNSEYCDAEIVAGVGVVLFERGGL